LFIGEECEFGEEYEFEDSNKKSTSKDLRQEHDSNDDDDDNYSDDDDDDDEDSEEEEEEEEEEDDDDDDENDRIDIPIISTLSLSNNESKTNSSSDAAAIPSRDINSDATATDDDNHGSTEINDNDNNSTATATDDDNHGAKITDNYGAQNHGVNNNSATDNSGYKSTDADGRIQPTAPSLPISSSASSSNRHRKRRVDDDDDDIEKGIVVRGSSSNGKRLSGETVLSKIVDRVRSSQPLIDNNYFLTWIQDANLVHFEFIAPIYGVIQNNFALTSTPNSPLALNSNNSIGIDACQVCTIIIMACYHYHHQ